VAVDSTLVPFAAPIRNASAPPRGNANVELQGLRTLEGRSRTSSSGGVVSPKQRGVRLGDWDPAEVQDRGQCQRIGCSTARLVADVPKCRQLETVTFCLWICWIPGQWLPARCRREAWVTIMGEPGDMKGAQYLTGAAWGTARFQLRRSWGRRLAEPLLKRRLYADLPGLK
jgi:hypothetical protein